MCYYVRRIINAAVYAIQIYLLKWKTFPPCNKIYYIKEEETVSVFLTEL